MAFWSKKRVDPARDKIGYLKQFGSRDLELLTSPVAGVPDSWNTLLDLPPQQRVETTIQAWDEVAENELRNTLSYFRTALADVELLRVDRSYHLLYSLTDPNGSPRYYVGGNPLRPDFGSNDVLREQWTLVPEALRRFYEKLHDGFFEFSSQSCGLDRLANVVRLADLDWGIIDQLGLEPRIDLATSYAFFNNGGGGYVVIDLARPESKATLWWSNDAPAYGLDFWDRVDDWTVLGITG
jgi:hypothetical protein